MKVETVVCNREQMMRICSILYSSLILYTAEEKSNKWTITVLESDFHKLFNAFISSVLGK